MNKNEIIIASKNKGKILEIKDIFSDLNLELISSEDAGIREEIKEDGPTPEHNAVYKAYYVSKITGKWALADDSGLFIDALGGAPGPKSRRFFGENLSDLEKCEKILDLMQNLPYERRTGKFICVAVLALFKSRIILTHGMVKGRIANKPLGENGFGYDPIFIPEGSPLTFAQMDLASKNRLSHRFKAFQAIKNKLLLLEEFKAYL